MKILGISGSPRKNGNTDIILNQILSVFDTSQIDIDLIYLRDYSITPCIGCERCRNDLTCTQFYDGMTLIYPTIEAADCLVLGSPVYNYNITSQMKSFIDRLYPYYIFSHDRPRKYSSRLSDKRRKVIIFSICEQTDPEEEGFAIEAMARPFEALGYDTIAKIPVNGFFDKGAVADDTELMRKIQRVGMQCKALLDI